MTIAVAGIVLLLVGLGRFVGCNTAETQKELKASSIKIQQEEKEAKDYLRSLLPSATTGALGAFLGFRRKEVPRA